MATNSSAIITMVTIIIVCIAVIASSMRNQISWRENYTDSVSVPADVTLINNLSGALPDSVAKYISLTCAKFYDSPNYSGSILKCFPPGMHMNSDDLEILKKTKSIGLPLGYFFQLYGKAGEFYSANGSSDLQDTSVLGISFEPQSFIILQTDVMTVSEAVVGNPDKVDMGRNIGHPAPVEWNLAPDSDPGKFNENYRIDVIAAHLSKKCDNDYL